jgi:hypothetical protein
MERMMRIWDFYSYLRKYVGAILIGGAAVTVALTPSHYAIYAMAVWGLIAAWLTVGAQIRTAKISRQFGGGMRDFVFAPTPMGSVLASLGRVGVSPETIATIELMSADVDETIAYFERDSGNGCFLTTLKHCPEMKVTVYGQTRSTAKEHSRITVVPTVEKYTEHTNLITTKDGNQFVWFEPYHNVKNGRHYFGKGAYLFEVTPKIADKVHKDLVSLPRAA